MSEPKLKDIANAIFVHLKAADEEDRRINKDTTAPRKYYRPFAWASGNRVMLKYVSYQGTWSLTKAEAIAYLNWLDAGNREPHFKMEKKQ